MATLPPQASLPQLQLYIRQLCAERGWDSNTHLEIFLLLSEEMGELAKAIRHHTSLYQEANKAQPDRYALEEEFADVLSYILDLANYFDIDLEQAFRAKQTANELRQWKKHQASEK